MNNAVQPRNGIVGLTAPSGSIIQNAQSNPAAVQAFIQACDAKWNSRTPTNDFKNSIGTRWALGTPTWTMFSTIVPPNARLTSWGSCRNACPGCGTDNSHITNASSLHPGGVNVTLGDGSVRFIKGSVNQNLWWALGTRAGGEVISSDSF